MIYTITFNPALDYIVSLPDYASGKVNRLKSEKILAGGKGINVSIVLNNLGIESTALGFISGFTGQEIKNILNKMRCNNDFIELNNGFSRINVKIKSDVETELNGQGPDITEADVKRLYEKLDLLKNGDMLVLAGSIPNTMPDSTYCDIIKNLSSKKLEFIVDATGDLLVNVLPYKPFLVKPNNYELGEIFGVEIKTREEALLYARKLQHMGARNVLVSLGENGAILIDENNNEYKSDPPKGRVINTTGCGDSMVAGFIAGYKEKSDYEYAFKLGMAAGSASAFSENLASRQETMQYYEIISTMMS